MFLEKILSLALKSSAVFLALLDSKFSIWPKIKLTVSYMALPLDFAT